MIMKNVMELHHGKCRIQSRSLSFDFLSFLNVSQALWKCDAVVAPPRLMIHIILIVFTGEHSFFLVCVSICTCASNFLHLPVPLLGCRVLQIFFEGGGLETGRGCRWKIEVTLAQTWASMLCKEERWRGGEVRYATRGSRGGGQWIECVCVCVCLCTWGGANKDHLRRREFLGGRKIKAPILDSPPPTNPPFFPPRNKVTTFQEGQRGGQEWVSEQERERERGGGGGPGVEEVEQASKERGGRELRCRETD